MTNDVKFAIEEFKKGKIEYRVDKTGIVHVSFGKANFQVSELIENLMLILVAQIQQNFPL